MMQFVLRVLGAPARPALVARVAVGALVALIATASAPGADEPSIDGAAASRYRWPRSPSSSDTLLTRFAAPAGSTRVAVAAGSFAAWLRTLPLLPAGTLVSLFDGTLKQRQDVQAAVVDLDVGKRDLQQCADAVMRLRAEYLYATERPIVFHPDAGRSRALRWNGGDRGHFERYLTRLFSDAGTASLEAEMTPVAGCAPRPGDVLIQGGYPGHAVLVLDVAESGSGAARRSVVLLGQSYMPAQQFHVVQNKGDAALSPWYAAADLADGQRGLSTPEWRPFFCKNLRRFGE